MVTLALFASLLVGLPAGEIDNAPIVQVFNGSGHPCGPWTPVGSSCICNHYVMRGHAKPGWVAAYRDGGSRKWARPGWHFTNTKGMHSSGYACYHDQ